MFVIRYEGVATFNGKHNRSKAKVLVFLYDRLENTGQGFGLSVNELSKLLDIPKGSLKSLCTRWHSWHYLKRRVKIDSTGELVYCYALAERGKWFVTVRIPKDILQEVRDAIYQTHEQRMQSIIKAVHLKFHTQ